MGPRLFSRGKGGAKWGFRARDGGLQWGRGFSAAESTMSGSSPVSMTKLQWGRGFSAAERSQRAKSLQHKKKLQWGRGFSAAESRA